ncbi:cell division protein FtsQ/DivIB [Neokomagataea thailandica]|uniref:cell division protein FtsQ/DivIB n=1 Tax=Neokomagataea TaxID=1223423 RepID=UPI000A004FE0|nr:MULTISPECIES: cell division protein FtsQ/DivIB [Neokomagataea]
MQRDPRHGPIIPPSAPDPGQSHDAPHIDLTHDRPYLPSEDRPSRLKLALRRFKRFIRPGFVVLTVLLLAGGAVHLLHITASEERFAPLRARLVAMEPLPIHHIIVNGRHITSQQAVENALGTSVGQPLFGFSVEAARARVNALPLVEQATVERRIPDTVIVNLTERVPIAVWQNHDHFSLINRAGDTVSDQGIAGQDPQMLRTLPLIVGDGANNAAADLLDALTPFPDIQNRITAFVRVGERRWDAVLRNGTTILLPEDEEKPAFARLEQFQNTMKLLDRPVVSIDMRLPDRMVIHQPPLPAQPNAPESDSQTKPQ